MRILWHSSNPETRTGYARVTKEIARRLRAAGHFVRCGCKHEETKWSVTSDGLEIFEATDVFLVNQMLDQENFDYIITLWDIWILEGKRQFPKDKWIAYVPVNTEELPQCYANVLANTSMLLAQTRAGQRTMKAAGFDSIYVPHGIDCNVFKPDEAVRLKQRSELGWTDDNFVIGTVGLNYGDDTKGYIPLLLAFREFHADHPEARLFLGTLANERGVVSSSINYWEVVRKLGLKDVVAWPNQSDYFLGRMTDDDLRAWYNAMDVFILPSKGESFGLPIVEAQACGTPIIVPNMTSGPELCKSGWLIEIDKLDDATWTPSMVWRYYPRPSRIIAILKEAYESWCAWKLYPENKSRNLNWEVIKKYYSWENVWQTHWLPIIAEMERRLKEGKK